LFILPQSHRAQNQNRNWESSQITDQMSEVGGHKSKAETLPGEVANHRLHGPRTSRANPRWSNRFALHGAGKAGIEFQGVKTGTACRPYRR
jgi:hypothetical protein